MQQYKLLVSELEAVLPLTPLQLWADASGFAGNGSAVADPLRALPAAVQNLHDYLIHVAARLERLHEAVDRAKDVFLDAMRKVRIRKVTCCETVDAGEVTCGGCRVAQQYVRRQRC